MRQILATALMASITFGPMASPVLADAATRSPQPAIHVAPTATPIKHLVIIFQENVSFDHYFATYPNATNPQGEPQFHAAFGTPTVNGLSNGLLERQSQSKSRQRNRSDQPLPAGPLAGCNQRSGPRLRSGAGGLRWRI